MATTPYSDRYTPELLETKPDGYVLQLTPIDKNSQYSRIKVTLDKEHFYPKLMEYYDQRNEKFKEATYEYEKIGKYWNAKEVEMTDLRKDHSTKILLKDVKFDQGLSDELFTVENLAPSEEK
jgi:outer membrane lipoprotein-sorting protein